MTIREYWAAQEAAAADMEELDEVLELERVMYEVWERDEDDFTVWACESGIDLTAVDEATGELVSILWGWDMSGE